MKLQIKNNQTLDSKKKKNQTRHTLIGKLYNKIQKMEQDDLCWSVACQLL